MDAAAYARQLKQLLPRGSLFALESDSNLSKLLLGIADELARIDGRAEDLVNEWDPRTCDDTIEDWERVLGVTPASGVSLAARRLLVSTMITAQGGSTKAYFAAVAAALGFSVTVVRTAVHTWTMTVDLSESTTEFALESTDFRAGIARAGDPLSSWRIPALEDVINRLKPAHTLALFVYVP